MAALELHRHGERAFDDLASELASSGLRAAWNRVLREERSATLGCWVGAHIKGTVLDLLCGDGRVGEWLGRQGVPIVLCERESAYGEVDRRDHQAPFVSFEQLDVRWRADTVLLSTVLHHEPDPESLLRFAASLGRVRLVIVENALEEQAPEDYQLLMDLFFNRCLNRFDVPSLAHHRTAASWGARAARFGKLLSCQRRDHLPGIPLPHHLIVVDLEASEAGRKADER